MHKGEGGRRLTPKRRKERKVRAKLIDDQTEDEVIGGHQEGFSIDGVS